MNSLLKTAILGVPLLFVGCTCTVTSGGSDSQSSEPEEWIKKEVVISQTRWVADSDTPFYFQIMRFYTVCIDGVNYLWEYKRDEMTVKYNRDGTISTCDMDDVESPYELTQ